MSGANEQVMRDRNGVKKSEDLAEQNKSSGGQKQQQQNLEGLPLESSPYVKYSDLEEYKLQGYGTEGHLEPVEKITGGGGTDAPTLSGSGLSQCQVRGADTIHGHAVP